MSTRRALIVVCCLLLAAVGGARAQQPFVAERDGVPTLAPLLAGVTPAVVNISVISRAPLEQNPLFRDPFFRRFFDTPGFPRIGPGAGRPSVAVGSGVIVDADAGLVLTNHHVVANGVEISVTLKDGRTLAAELVGSDPPTDIAVLRIPSDGLSALAFGDSDSLQVGDYVLAIGNPFGLGQTVTSGIVSALGRTGISNQGYEDFIQTDASINPGNSGGALIDLHGALIGINTSIIGPSGGNVGIGFAVPSRIASSVMDQIVAYGEVRRGRLGIAYQDVTPDLAELLGMPQALGVVVTRVEQGSVADQAGLVTGDVIVEINGRPIRDSMDLHNRVGLAPVDAAITIGIIRDGARMDVEAELVGLAEGPIDAGQRFDALPGATFHDILPGMALYGRIAGVLVGAVEPGSGASRLGLEEGDVIVGVNQRDIASLADLASALEDVGRSLALTIRRGGGTVFLFIG
ncbi:MAG: Do family serine endopeptidase [Alphaproteobacteria bacterium]